VEEVIQVTAFVLLGDVRERLADLADDSIQTCITSPPYWGLRDYGNANQLGAEADPRDYIATMVDVFREVRRVLRPDGALWLNLGDSYYNNFGGGSASMTTGNATAVRQKGRRNVPKHDTLKMKDLIGVPWEIALALRNDGWYLRQDIIWSKTNPIPESVTDRCTKAHEYLFLLTKSPRYFFDHNAIKEQATSQDGQRNKRSVWSIPVRPFKDAHFAVMPEALVEPCVLATSRVGDTVLDPFMGAGTVGLVAIRHGRVFAGCEINEQYVDIATKRLEPLTRLETR
jgi:site-specific DNA-methyltransferase (cytosine-N4-specific)